MTTSICVGGVVSTLLDGLFEIDDRGDGIAEIKLKAHFGETTGADAVSAAEWDDYVGRPRLPLPAGFKITSAIVGFVHGDSERVLAAQDDEGNWTRTESALPGVAHIVGACEVRVETMEGLERYLRENQGIALGQGLTAARRDERRPIN
jgi:hypothetical protein